MHVHRLAPATVCNRTFSRVLLFVFLNIVESGKMPVTCSNILGILHSFEDGKVGGKRLHGTFAVKSIGKRRKFITNFGKL